MAQTLFFHLKVGKALPQGEAYCNVLTHYFAQWTPKILGYQILKVGALSGEIAFDLPLRHQIVLAEKTAYFSTALLNESDSLIQASPLALPFIEKKWMLVCWQTP